MEQTQQPVLPTLGLTFEQLVPEMYRPWFNSTPPAELARGLILRHSGLCVPEDRMQTPDLLKSWVVENCQSMNWNPAKPAPPQGAATTTARRAEPWISFPRVIYSCVEGGTCTFTRYERARGYDIRASDLRGWLEEAIEEGYGFASAVDHVADRLRARILEDPPETETQSENHDDYETTDRSDEEVDLDNEDFEAIVQAFLDNNPDLQERLI